MAGPKEGSPPVEQSSVRPPAVAGMFYPAEAQACRALAKSFVENAPRASPDRAEKTWIGGIVPHAGWVCSGAIAGQTISSLAAAKNATPVDVVVVFGAVHTPARFEFGALDSHAKWATPGSESALPLSLQKRLLEKGNLFSVEARLHQNEHAVEVEVPLIQLAWPRALLLPIETPAVASAPLIGRKT